MMGDFYVDDNIERQGRSESCICYELHIPFCSETRRYSTNILTFFEHSCNPKFTKLDE